MLTFEELRQSNKSRCQDVDGFNHDLSSWTTTDWTNAVAGEVGEACNISKKMLRLKQGMYNKKEDKSYLDLKYRLGDEIADAVIYLDLLASSLELKLEDLIRHKFNDKSVEIGASQKI